MESNFFHGYPVWTVCTIEEGTPSLESEGKESAKECKGGNEVGKANIDPEAKELLEMLAKRGIPPVHTLPPQEARRTRNPLFVELGGAPVQLHIVEERVIPGPSGNIQVRIYIPSGEGRFPVLVYFHGGGWVIGDLSTHDSLCRVLARRTPCVVVSVDYRLAPEHKFPAAVEDAFAAMQWAVENAEGISGDPRRIAVGGDSAGGNLATVVCLLARDRGAPSPAFQMLLYPVTDLSNLDTATYREHGEGYILTRKSMEYYRRHYLREPQDAEDPYASPLLASDLRGLPPAYVLAAEVDVLTDEICAYVQRLRETGVEIIYRVYEGMIHPFVSFLGVLNRAKEAVGEATSVLGTALSG